MCRDVVEKKTQLRKRFTKIAIKRIRIKFDIKLNENKCLRMELKKKQINQKK